MKKIVLGGVLNLAKLSLRNYWLMIVWIGLCIFLFRCDYLHYKKAPQYYYLRRMLGLGVCISRGTAAILNVGIFLLVLPMGKSFLSLVRGAFPIWLSLPIESLFPSSKTMHLVMAFTVLLTSVAHSISHIANTINFSRNYIAMFPEVNMASYKGESPMVLIFTTVPGITGVCMLLILTLLSVTSLKCIRTRQFEIFYFTHYCCFLFLVILLIHPLSGALKGVLNVDSHPPGCRFKRNTMPGEESVKTLNNTNSLEAKLREPNSKISGSILMANIISKTVTQSSKNGTTDIKINGIWESPTLVERLSNHGTASKDTFLYPDLLDEVLGFPEPETELYEESYQDIDEVLGFPEPDPQPYEENYQDIDEELGFPEPEPGPFEGYYQDSDEVQGFPEPEPELYEHDLKNQDLSNGLMALNIHDDTSPRNGNSHRSKLDQSNLDHLKYNRKRRKICLKPPLFVNIESKTWLWVLMALSYLFINCIIKHWRGQKEVEVVRVREFHANVLELTLRKKGFHCNPGQYILLRCPKIAKFEWHPFTVAQCPRRKSEYFTVLIRTKGNWCQKLRDQLILEFLETKKNNISFQSSQEERKRDSLEKTHKFSDHYYCSRSFSKASAGSRNKTKEDSYEAQETLTHEKQHLTYFQSSTLVNHMGKTFCHHKRSNSFSSPLNVQNKFRGSLGKDEDFRKFRHSYHDKNPNCHVHRSNNYITQSHNRINSKIYRNHKLLSIHNRITCSKCKKRYDITTPINTEDRTNLCNSQYPMTYTSLSPKKQFDSRPSKCRSQVCSTDIDNYPPSFENRDCEYHDQCPHLPCRNSPSHCDSHYLKTNNESLLSEVRSEFPIRAELDNNWSIHGGEFEIQSTTVTALDATEFGIKPNPPYLVRQKSRNKKLDHCIVQIDRPQGSPPIRMYIDGPFHSPNEAALFYPVVIGIAGGIGVTPLLASLNNILASGQPNPRRLHIVWILRELHLILPLASFFQTLIEFFWTKKEEDRLELRFHCTGYKGNQELEDMLQKQFPFLKARLHGGRPNWNELFDVWKETYRRCKVGVFCCGPKSLNREIRNYTLKALSQGLNFDYHHESFS